MAEFDPAQYRHFTEPQLEFLSVIALNEGRREVEEGTDLLADFAVFEWQEIEEHGVDQLTGAYVDFSFLNGIRLTRIDFLPYTRREDGETPWAVGSSPDSTDTQFLDDDEMEDFVFKFKKASDSGLFVPESD